MESTEFELVGDVLIGKDGWLFLAGGNHHVLAYARGQRPINPKLAHMFQDTIRGREERLNRRHIPFVHAVFPDKHMVYPELAGLSSPLSLFQRYYEIRPTPRGIYLLDSLLAAKSHGSLYRKTDTHLNPLGNLTALKAVLAKLDIEISPEESAVISSSFRETPGFVGDLGKKLTPERAEIASDLRMQDGVFLYANALPAGNNGICEIFINTAAKRKKRVLMFGDSFVRVLAPYVSAIFSEVVFARTPFVHDEMVDGWAAEIVISGTVERFLRNITPEADRFHFLLYPHLQPVAYKAPERYAQALIAVLGRSHNEQRYEDFLATHTRAAGPAT